MKQLLFLLFIGLLVTSSGFGQEPKWSWLEPNAKWEKLWGEGEFTEGPCLAPDGSIYFSDIGNRIMQFDPVTKKTKSFRDPSGRANGLKFDAKGRLVACEGANKGGNRRLSITIDGKIKTLADQWNGKKLNSPNDLALDHQGRIYFTDPRYVGDEKREIDQEGVYRIDTDGKVIQIISDVVKPNGIVISPDQKTLYLALADNNPKGKRQLISYPLDAKGNVGKPKLLYDFGTDRGIDGMAITDKGLLVTTGMKDTVDCVLVFSPEGKLLDFIPTPESPSNCCFGGKDFSTLYLTAGKSLYQIPTKLKGISP